jgi:recombination protein RecT
MTTQATQQVAQAQPQPQQPQKSAILAFTAKLNGSYMSNYLLQTLGEKKSEFVANITTLVSNDTKLQECEANSIIFSALKATALDLPLDPNLGMAYVIPFKNTKKGIKEAQFQIGYKGFTQLAIRSGQFKTINVRDVREGEIVGEDFISGEMQFKRVEGREDKPVIGYVAYFRLINGFEKMSYWRVEELVEHAKKYSQTYTSQYQNVRDSSKWTTDFDGMAKKTVIKLLLSKYAPLSIQMQSAIKADQAIITEQGERYIDNEPQQVLIPADQASKATDKVTDMLKGAFDAEVIEETNNENQPKDTLFE